MNLDIQFKLKSNPNYIKYIRENSWWYKLLSRNPNLFNEFTKEVKEKYKLRTVDKLNDAMNTIEMLQMLLSTMK